MKKRKKRLSGCARRAKTVSEGRPDAAVSAPLTAAQYIDGRASILGF